MADVEPAMPKNEIARRVVAHFRKTRRDLPWRRAASPYAVWVSEIMLQQTRIDTALPYYERWLERFPTVEALAAAPLDEVLAAWAGLGYYSRARNLHRGAAEVVARYGGELPASAKALKTLPGIGRYTAGAIASVAFGAREPAVDGNIARVLARLFDIDDDIRKGRGQKKLWALAAGLVPDGDAGDFNQGLMELGQTVCIARAPRCGDCPVADLCIARARGRESELPRTSPRVPAKELPLLSRTALWIEQRGKIALCRRRPEGLYGGLWELPSADSVTAPSDAFASTVKVISPGPVMVHRQTLTHRRLRVEVFRARMAGPIRSLASGCYDCAAWLALASAKRYGIAASTAAIIQAYWETSRWTTTDNSTRSRSLPTATGASSKA